MQLLGVCVRTMGLLKVTLIQGLIDDLLPTH
jgi:hypothetical protein